MKYPNIKRLKLSHKILSRAFGFKTVGSFRASSAHKRYMNAIEEILTIIESNYGNNKT